MYPDVDDVIIPEEYLLEESLVDMLVAYESPNVQDESGNTPLHYAAGQHNHDEVARLIGQGASVSIKNSEGQLPLQGYVVTEQAVRTLWAVKDAALQPWLVEKMCIRPMLALAMHARQFDFVESQLKQPHMKEALKHFTESKSRNSQYTALMNIAIDPQEHLDLMKLLIDNSSIAMLRHTNKLGKSLVDYLVENHHKDTLKYLAKKAPSVYTEPAKANMPNNDQPAAQPTASVGYVMKLRGRPQKRSTEDMGQPLETQHKKYKK